MPELPEVEHLRRSLEPDLVGARIEEVSLFRDDIVLRTAGRPGSPRHSLLAGSTVARLDRRGKQLAIVAEDGQGLVIQLGMSGQVRWAAEGRTSGGNDHVHACWRVRDGRGLIRRLEFRDPRRFGGLSPFDSAEDLATRLWSRLGPDAVDSPAHLLTERLLLECRGSRRRLKTVLLDQESVAGIGNIYADEALFASGLHPFLLARRLTRSHAERLVQHIQRILVEAVHAGGSTLRDYVDASGRSGSFQHTHQVYGRAGLDCRRCSTTLRSGLLQARTTVWCPSCQRRTSGRP